MNHTPEPRYSARSTTPHSWRVWDSYNNEPIAFCDSDDEARYIARALNALAGRVPGELARLEVALCCLLSTASLSSNSMGTFSRLRGESEHLRQQCEILRAALAEFRGEMHT